MSNDPTEVFAGIKDRAISNINVKKQKNRVNISIGKGTCGIAAGALETQRAIEGTLAQEGIEASVFSTGCMGHCYAEPVVIIDNPDSGFPPIFYHQVTPGKAKMIIHEPIDIKQFSEKDIPTLIELTRNKIGSAIPDKILNQDKE